LPEINGKIFPCERDFEFISICPDDSIRKAKALKFLKNNQIPDKNYLFHSDDK